MKLRDSLPFDHCHELLEGLNIVAKNLTILNAGEFIVLSNH